MAESAVAFLLNELSIFLHSQISQLGGGLQGDVQFIRDELGSMRAFLRDAEAKEDDVSELQEWISQVREVAYDTEDVLDEFVMRFSRHHHEGFYGRVHKIYCSIKNIRARREISSKIKDIKSRVEEISERHQRYRSLYGLSERGGSCSAAAENIESHIRGNALLLEEADLVGIEEPKRELISRILDNSSDSKVVSVVGMGGLGKTTLVKRVYEDANVKRHFQIHAWLTISQTFHMKAILKGLTQQLYQEIKEPVPPHVESMDGDNLRAFVNDVLKEKRFIVVLDDLWKLESWEAIKYAFPQINCGSRIILTTRIADTALGSCRECGGYIHKMQPLSNEESWTLFCRKTFGDSCSPPHLEDVSKSILKKCEGLPLAIISIGGVLALKQKSKLEWEMILRSLGGEMEGTGKLERVKKILLLSYSDLPFFLKNCLLYMSIYPEDFSINANILIQHWIAQGFILEREGMTTTEVAMEYLNELFNRSLIQVVTLGNCGEISFFRIHDILRKIIITKSREHNFVTVANMRGDHTTRLSGNIRRLIIYGSIENCHEYNCFRHLRSLKIIGYTNPLYESWLSKLLSGGPNLLKILDLYGAKELKRIPKEIFKLFHLRYLRVIGTGVQIIPQSIGKLQNLEYLNLAGTSVMALPSGILKLRKLRELHVSKLANYSENFAARGFKAPCKFGNLLSLQILYYINADNETVVKEIGKLTQLRELGISNLRREDGKELCSTLRNLTNLRRLFVNSINVGEILDLQHPMSPIPQGLQVLGLYGRLEKVPQWVPCLEGLSGIYLSESRLREDPLEILQDLPNLMHMALDKAYEGEELCFKAKGFQKLKGLGLTKLQQKQVTIQEDALPCLQRLSMTGCKLLDELPWGIQKLNKLQYLQLRDMGNKLIIQLHDKGSEEYKKVAQISKIEIFNWIDDKWEQCFL